MKKYNSIAEKYARKDSVTGKGMNDGFCFDDGDFYCASSLDALAKCEELGYKTMEEAYNEEAYYWTEWEIEEGENYFDEHGNEFDENGTLLNDLFHEDPESLPIAVQEILKAFTEKEIENYDDCAQLVKDLEKVGYTCDYYLDAQPFNLRKI